MHLPPARKLSESVLLGRSTLPLAGLDKDLVAHNQKLFSFRIHPPDLRAGTADTKRKGADDCSNPIIKSENAIAQVLPLTSWPAIKASRILSSFPFFSLQQAVNSQELVLSLFPLSISPSPFFHLSELCSFTIITTIRLIILLSLHVAGQQTPQLILHNIIHASYLIELALLARKNDHRIVLDTKVYTQFPPANDRKHTLKFQV